MEGGRGGEGEGYIEETWGLDIWAGWRFYCLGRTARLYAWIDGCD